MESPDTPGWFTPATTLGTLRILSVLAVLNLLWQFISAGEILAGGHHDEAWVDPHGVGAIVLHVLTGLTALAAGAYWYASRGRLWPTVTSVVVFVLTFVQAYFGDDRFLSVHIPGALVVTIGIVTVAAWSFTGARRRPDNGLAAADRPAVGRPGGDEADKQAGR
jgi:hypothetical protein